jgi:hypothetical protein
MTALADTKARAIYHTILADMHRLEGVILNLQTLSDDPSVAGGLQEHFTREQTLLLGKLSEWKQRRPDVYRQAAESFRTQRTSS